MVLGCSNTYQQLITALKVDEIRWVLSKHGDSKIGTNSPWSINHKRSGKLKAWLAWILLIGTSIVSLYLEDKLLANTTQPVHFLANSVFGPSFLIHPPTTFTWTLVSNRSELSDIGVTILSVYPKSSDLMLDSGCWTAFRANSYVLPSSMDDINSQIVSPTSNEPTAYASAEIFHTPACTQL